ncbi:MAG: HEPN domain-containing protein [bacterium]
MNPSDELRDEIGGLLDKATRALAAATEHHSRGDFDFASSRAYYATFYAMTAGLLVKKLTFSRHGGVMAAFGEHFIKSGTFPRDFGVKISRLFRERQLADYEAGLPISSDAAAEDIADATAIVSAVQGYLGSAGFDGGLSST